MVEAGRLTVVALRARFASPTRLVFPANAAVPIRGALGFCLPQEIFRPHRDSGPSGMRDAPRPFVLRVRHLNSRSFGAGEPFEIGLNLFAPDLLGPFADALRQLACAGLGPGRVALEWGGLHSSSEVFDMDAIDPNKTLQVCFLSPTQMKGWNGVGLPAFEILIARIRDRVSALASLYGGGPLDLDFRGLAERARLVRTVSGNLTDVKASRTSSRTGQTHPLSGVTGPVRYEGELSEFIPLLRAACRTGVGRQTVWGHGEIEIQLGL